MEAAETKTVKKKEEAKRRRGEASGIGESKCFGILKRRPPGKSYQTVSALQNAAEAAFNFNY